MSSSPTVAVESKDDAASEASSPSIVHPKPNVDATGEASSPAKFRTNSNTPSLGKSSSPTSAATEAIDTSSGDLSPATSVPEDQRNGAGQNGREAKSPSDIQVVPASYAFLALAAETLEDIERARIAAENRARALVHPEQNIQLPSDDPHVALAKGIASELQAVEHRAELALKRMLRDTPLAGWVKQTVGVGEKQAARLLGVIGDPSLRIDGETGEIHERTVGQLRSYCGYGDAREQKRRKGVQGNWNPKARMRAYLIAESCMKSPTSPYRKVYEDGRAKYEDSVHEHPCPQCGAKGKPAEVGSELRDGHKHARALRLVAKEMLKDLWIAAGQRQTD